MARLSLPSVTSQIPQDLRNFIDRLRDVIATQGLATDRDVDARVRQLALQTEQSYQRLQDQRGSVSQVITQIDQIILGSKLYQALAAEIKLINGPSDLLGSAASLVAAEAKARAEALAEEALARAGALAAEAQARAAEILVEAQNRASAISAEVQARTNAIAAEAQNRASAISAEVQARAEAVSAEAQARTAAIEAESLARSNAVSAARDEFNALVAEINLSLAEIEAIKAFDPGVDYALNELTRYDGKLYRAIQSMTAPSPYPMDAAYWEKIGDYASFSEAISAHAAAISALNTVDADSTSATASTLANLQAAVENPTDGLASRASKTELDEVEAGVYGAESSSFTGLTAQFDYAQAMDKIGDLGAEVLTHAEAIARADSIVRTKADIYGAEASEFTQLSARFGDVDSAISTEATARSTADSALASDITALTTRVGDTEAEIITEQSARSTADSAITSAVSQLTTRVGDNESAIVSEQIARSTADTSIASDLTALTARVGGAEADIITEQSARSSADSAITTDLTALTTRVGDNESAIVSEQTARSTADSAITTDLTALTTRVGDNESAIVSEQTARSTADSALAADVTALTTRVGGAEADIITEQSARSSADSAITTDLSALTAAVEHPITGLGSRASKTELSEAEANIYGAEVTQFSNISAEFSYDESLRDITNAGLDVFSNAEAAARIDSYQRVETNVLGASVESFSLLSAKFGEIDSTIVAEQTARSTADTSIASDLTALTTRVGGAEADIITEQSARSIADSAIASDLTALTTRVGDAEADIITEQSARSSADSAITTDLTALTTRVGDAEADIVTEQSARSTADSAITTDLTALTTRVGDNEAAIVSEQSARSTADSAITTDLTALTTRVGDNESAIVSEQTARSTADTSIASDLTALTARVGGAESDIITEQSARSTADSAITTDLNSLSAVVNNATTGLASKASLDYVAAAVADGQQASVVTFSQINARFGTVDSAVGSKATITEIEEALVTDTSAIAANVKQLVAETEVGGRTVLEVAGEVTDLEGQYTVKIDNNGYVTGFGLASRPNEDGDAYVSEFYIRADRFAVGSPDVPGAPALIPFKVLATWTDGHAPGVYIDAAKIINLQADFTELGITAQDIISHAGLGTLATQNSVAYSALTGTRPPTNADNTASNTAAGIAGQGNLATQDTVRIGHEVKFANGSTIGAYDLVTRLAKIGSANQPIANVMATSAITNAYIGNAQVSTLKIAGNAVTVPVSHLNASIADWAGNISTWVDPGEVGFRDLCWVLVDTDKSGQPINVTFSVRAGYDAPSDPDRSYCEYVLVWYYSNSWFDAGTQGMSTRHSWGGAYGYNDFPMMQYFSGTSTSYRYYGFRVKAKWKSSVELTYPTITAVLAKR